MPVRVELTGTGLEMALNGEPEHLHPAAALACHTQHAHRSQQAGD